MKLTLLKSKLLLTMLITPVIFTACGGGGETTTTTISTNILNSQNYIEIAKKIYAKQIGKDSDIKIEKQLPPGAKTDPNKLYLTNLVKPRGYIITKIEAKQADNTLSIDIDKENKYAQITLSGSQNAQTKMPMKQFTIIN